MPFANPIQMEGEHSWLPFLFIHRLSLHVVQAMRLRPLQSNGYLLDPSFIPVPLVDCFAGSCPEFNMERSDWHRSIMDLTHA